MTKKEFQAAMLCGLGRCVRAVQQDSEKYRDIVLWACKRNIAYDAQSEGTRAWYVYTMVSSYPDKAPFINAASEALRQYRPHAGWDLTHLSELLMLFAEDGYDAARQAVEEKYAELLASLHSRQRSPRRVFHELSDLEQLGLLLAVDRTSFLGIAADFGRLYREKRYLLDWDFACFFELKGNQYRRTLERAAKQDADIACFLEREQERVRAWNASREQRKADAPETLSGIRLSHWLARNADAETLERYALAYREENRPELRGELLKAFRCCPYPGDPQPILEDTHSACEALQGSAWRALAHIRHPAVREFALDNAHNGIHTPENFALLVTNYTPRDAELLEKLLLECIAAKDWDGVHAAGMDIGRAFRRDSGIPHPRHLLPLVYAYTPCSCCREATLAHMARHRMLTTALLEECLYDSNCDIRKYAEKRLKQ